MFDEISAFVEKIPPLTRYICITTFVLSLSVQFQLVSPLQLVLDVKQLLKFQFWRLFTSMCLSSGFALLMHLYFINSWLTSLESQTFRGRKGDCFMMLMFIMISLSVIGIAMGLPVLTNSFSMAIVYIWASQNPAQIVQFMFGLTFKAALLPWVILGFDVLQGGSPIPGIVGIIVGYSYHFLESIYPATHNGAKIFVTPGFVKDALDTLEPREMASSAGGYSSQPGKSNASSGAESSSSGKFSGKGYKLGT